MFINLLANTKTTILTKTIIFNQLLVLENCCYMVLVGKTNLKFILVKNFSSLI